MKRIKNLDHLKRMPSMLYNKYIKVVKNLVEIKYIREFNK